MLRIGYMRSFCYHFISFWLRAFNNNYLSFGDKSFTCIWVACLTNSLSAKFLFSQIAFHPKFSSSRVEKERRAILSELQMMNTIEYRVDCQASNYFTLYHFLGHPLRRDCSSWDTC